MPVSLTVEASLPEPRIARNHTAWRCRFRTETGFHPHGRSPRMGATSQGANGSSAPLTIRVPVSVPVSFPRFRPRCRAGPRARGYPLSGDRTTKNNA